MDRRFFTWLMLTTAMCFLYLSMRPTVQPPEEAAKDKAPISADPLLRADGQAAGDDTAAEPNGDNSAAAAEVTSLRPDHSPQVITLGSMDPAKNFNLMVVLTSAGAAVEHAELVGHDDNGRLRFRALEHEGGYLGYLGLVEDLRGMKIRTVPEGSAAAFATSNDASGGLQPGDVLTEVAGNTIDSHLALENALSRTKPDQSIEVAVLREIDGSEKSMRFSVQLQEAPLDILRMSERSTEAIVGNQPRSSLRTTLGSLQSTHIPAGQNALPALSETLFTNWETHDLEVPGGQGVEFRLALDSYLAKTGRPAKIDLVKRYRLLPASETNDGYLLDLKTVIVNRNDEDVMISFRQEGLAGLTLEGWWYSVKISPYMFSGAGQRDVIYRSESAGHQLVTTRQIQDYAKKNAAQPDRILLAEGEPAETRTLKYIGLDSQYFNASLMAHPDTPHSLHVLRRAGAAASANPEEILKSQAQATNTTSWIETEDALLPAGGQLSNRYQVFIGPKDTEVLAAHGLGEAIEYGWFPWIAIPLSTILHFFHWIVGNYGIAIIMLTVLVRGLMFPLGRKAAMNAQRMQELQPEIKKLNDKYKDSMERAKAMQDLYKKHNFKPLAGCLPLFIQLPIFIGLYRCLSVDISLRQEPLIPGLSWCSNLAGPDMLFAWGSWMPEFIAGRGTGWLGPYFNILPLVTVGLFLLQQKMLMPKATDEQTRMTQNMMQIMTVFMGVLFFKVPSGLCIYFITSSLWSLIERKLVKRMTPASASVSSTVASSTSEAPKKSGGKPNRDRSNESTEKPKGRMKELMDLLDKPAVKSSTQRGSGKGSRPNRKKEKRKRR